MERFGPKWTNNPQALNRPYGILGIDNNHSGKGWDKGCSSGCQFQGYMPYLIIYTEPSAVNGDKNGIKRTYSNKPCLNQVQATTFIKKNKKKKQKHGLLCTAWMETRNKYRDFYIIVALYLIK